MKRSFNKDKYSHPSENDNFPNIKKINPLSADEYAKFSYSRNFHLSFFQNNHYDELLFGKKISAGQIDIPQYRNLLLFSFITDNIPKGSRILKIGNDNDFVINHFKYERECFKLENPEILLKEASEIEKGKTHLIKNIDGKSFAGIPKEFFDIIFSKAGFDNFKCSDEEQNSVLNNINRMLKPGGYAFFNFTGLLMENKIRLNSAFQSLQKNFKTLPEKYFPVSVTIDKNNIKKDSDLINFRKTINTELNENVFSYNFLWRKKTLSLSKHTLTIPAQFLKKSPAYIFHHLIKCGGNSILSVIQKWFKMEVDRVETYGDKSRFIKYKINHLNIFSDTCITSHFQYDGVFLHQRYPELIARKNEFRIFIFVRDPLSFRISHYYYTRHEAENSIYTLEQVLSCDENWISKLIPCNEFNYKEVMDKYFFIGITEKMQESFDLLADLAGKKRIKLPFANVSEKDDQVSELSKEFIDEFKKRNKLDYMIYQYCLEKFNKALLERNLQK